jgi:hypothetical protein
LVPAALAGCTRCLVPSALVAVPSVVHVGAISAITWHTITAVDTVSPIGQFEQCRPTPGIAVRYHQRAVNTISVIGQSQQRLQYHQYHQRHRPSLAALAVPSIPSVSTVPSLADDEAGTATLQSRWYRGDAMLYYSRPDSRCRQSLTSPSHTLQPSLNKPSPCQPPTHQSSQKAATQNRLNQGMSPHSLKK